MSGIENVVREVSSSDSCDPTCQRIVAIDTRTGQLATGTGIPIFGKRRHLLISNARHPHAVAERTGLAWSVRDFEQNRSGDLVIDYRVECPPGQEEKVAMAFYAADQPVTALNQAVLRWAKDYVLGIGGDGVFLERYSAHEARIREHIRNRASEETGLSLTARITLQGDSVPELEEVKNRRVSVTFSNFGGSREVIVDARLERVPGATAPSTAPRPASEIPGRVEATIVEYFQQHVLLEDYYSNLSTSVTVEARRRVEAALAGEGYRVYTMRLMGSASNGVEALALDHELELELYDREQPTRVQIRLSLQRRSIPAFERASAPEMRAWAIQAVERIVRNALLKKSLADVYAQLDALQVVMELRMKELASSVGYDVEQFVVVADLPLFKLRDSFSVSVTSPTLSTRRAGVQVALAIVVVGRLRDFSRFSRLLRRGLEVEEAIREEILQVARNVLCEVEPDEFYLHFDQAGVAGRPCVEARLREAIRSALSDHGAELRQITCNRSDTDITRLLDELVREPHRLELTITPRLGLENLGVVATFNVMGIREAGWQQFVQHKPTGSTLMRAIGDCLTERLSEADMGWLKSAGYDEIRIVVNQVIGPHLGRQFGVAMECASWQHKMTTTGGKLRDVITRLDGEAVGVMEAVGLATLNNEREAIKHIASVLARLRAAYEEEVVRDPSAARELQGQIAEKEAELLERKNRGVTFTPHIEEQIHQLLSPPATAHAPAAGTPRLGAPLAARADAAPLAPAVEAPAAPLDTAPRTPAGGPLPVPADASPEAPAHTSPAAPVAAAPAAAPKPHWYAPTR